jgi:hypothetical protein
MLFKIIQGLGANGLLVINSRMKQAKDVCAVRVEQAMRMRLRVRFERSL